jgi:hypothetical protein
MALTMARVDNPQWIISFDADERIDWDFKGYENYDVIVQKLFDFYITPEDEYMDYKNRKWIGPEYREITMMYRNLPKFNYELPDQRNIFAGPSDRILKAGYVKHYGKAISEEQWEETCEYYATHFPEPYKTKWKNRHGKAIHSDYLSDFGAQLIKWSEKETKGYQLKD